MANMREIRSRMKSIEEIMKITNAMYLISSSKMKKARRNLDATQPYFEKLQTTIHHILDHLPDFRHSFFDPHKEVPLEERKRGYIVITSDKGMAGAYNHNVLKLAEEAMARGKNNSLFVVGQLGRMYFTRKKYMIDGEFLYTAQNPTLYRARAIAETVTGLFEERLLDEVYVVYSEMVNAAKIEPKVLKLLPFERGNFNRSDGKIHQDVTFSPSVEKVMDHLVPNYLKGLLYGAMVEAFCSEQSARMTAMKSATDSAHDMIRELSLHYNRARQAAITQEITEVAGGANSLKGGAE